MYESEREWRAVDRDEQEFTSSEVSQIIRSALQQGHANHETKTSYEDLLAIADELGISPVSLASAVAETEAGKKLVRVRKNAAASFYYHATVFGAVCGGLFLLNVATWGSWWFQYPLICWGVPVAIHGTHVYLKNKTLYT